MAGKSNALSKKVQPDEALAGIVGSAPIARTEITRRVWDHIKKKKLQDPEARRNIRADELLQPIFGKKKVVSMFELTKLVSEHILKG